MRKISIAIDAMGGDRGCKEVVRGIGLFLKNLDKKDKNNFDIRFTIYGLETEIKKLLYDYPKIANISEICGSVTVVDNNDRPHIALKNKKDSSMFMSVQSVKDGLNNCIISAGNTGALFLISKYVMGTIDGISRPAIVGVMPTMKGMAVVLDMGANLECNSDALIQFAYMGTAFAKSVLKIEQPSLALINIGTEASKGTDSIKEAYQILQSGDRSGINFSGYIEPTTIFDGKIDVIVGDGFTGNVLIKTMESTYHFLMKNIKQSISKSFLKMGFIPLIMLRYLFLNKMIRKYRPHKWNGALFAGINGTVVKSHGNSTALDFANAIEFAFRAEANNLKDNIVNNIENIQ
ncbi:phosphate acyltransferase PlsX [Anaplasmataceae bacterium AB001_6]|nr:phosphate acyltransferase PlsX [Anaplasmataceae bacterium AB001_6]